MVQLVEDWRYLDRDGNSIDPPMTDYQSQLLGELRQIFSNPYLVYKTLERPNASGLSWNPDFWVEKPEHNKPARIVLVIKVLGPDTTIENFDARMRDAYATMVLNWDLGRHDALFAADARSVIVPDKVLDELGHQRYLKYHYALESFACEITRRNHVVELELYRDKEDRDKRPLDGRRR